MTTNHRLHGLTISLAVVVLFAAQSATADVIELNNFWAGSGSVNINFTGINWHNGTTVTGLNESGGSGGFKTYNLTTDSGKANPFQSFCVDIFHGFSFAVDSLDTLKPADVALAGSTATTPTTISSHAAVDLGRLFTNHQADISSTGSSANNEAAFQLAVWEIVNERSGSYGLAGGDFRATGTGYALANSWLGELATTSNSAYTANIWAVQSTLSSGHGYAQDVVVFAPVPEPQTYAMLLAGLGVIGFTLRHRRNTA